MHVLLVFQGVSIIDEHWSTRMNHWWIIDEHWHLLLMDSKLKNKFQEKPIIAYKRNSNLKEIIGNNKILNNKVIRKKKAEQKHFFWSPCYTRSDNLCCQQVEKTNVFKSYKTGQTYRIFHQLTCKKQAIIYLLQCRTCFIQYVGKSGTNFNVRLYNHRKDSKKKDAILACTHFQKSNHSTRCKICSYWTNNKEI